MFEKATGNWFVVPGSGTGGLRGEGSFAASRGEQQFGFTLDYDFG